METNGWVYGVVGGSFIVLMSIVVVVIVLHRRKRNSATSDVQMKGEFRFVSLVVSFDQIRLILVE